MQIGCIHDGKDSTGKKVPLKSICGKVIKLASGGITLSVFASPEMTKPNPMKTKKAKDETRSIFITVIAPCTSVKLKACAPMNKMISVVKAWKNNPGSSE